jgi:predicted flap endonuclease-1-like 5' DNA nuclease
MAQQTRGDQLQVELDALKAQLAEKDTLLASPQSEILRLTAELESVKHEIKAAESVTVDQQAIVVELKDQQAELQARLLEAQQLAETRQAAVDTLERENAELRARLEAPPAVEPLTVPGRQLSFATETELAPPATKLRRKSIPADDLEIINGIGPVFAKKLIRGGVRTFQQLAGATPDQLEAIIKAPEWRTPDYAFWIKQAKKLAK